MLHKRKCKNVILIKQIIPSCACCTDLVKRSISIFNQLQRLDPDRAYDVRFNSSFLLKYGTRLSFELLDLDVNTSISEATRLSQHGALAVLEVRELAIPILVAIAA